MNTLVLLLSRDSEWTPEIWAYERGGKLGVGGQVMIEGQSAWLSVCRDEDVLNEYAVEERAAVLTTLTDPVPFVIEWKGVDLLSALLQAVPPDTRAVVDNDHGLLVPIRTITSLRLDSWLGASKLP